MLQESLKTTNADIYEDEDFLELLDRFNCRSRVHPLNVYGVVLELAQQKLILKPYLMVCTWTNTLKYTKTLKDFDTPESVIKFYAKIQTKTKGLAKLFYSDPTSEGDIAPYRFFIHYIRSLEDFESTKLLQFLTGSDKIIIKNIEVFFSAMEGIARRPMPIHMRQC